MRATAVHQTRVQYTLCALLTWVFRVFGARHTSSHRASDLVGVFVETRDTGILRHLKTTVECTTSSRALHLAHP